MERIIKTIQIVLYLFYSCLPVFSQHQISKIEEHSVSGFKLSVYLPPGYDSVKNAKVLFFNDGQTLFDEYSLRMDKTADELINSRWIEPIIIVGIHSDVNRTSNYVPYSDEGARQDFGDYQPNAGKYTEKIIRQIIPYIEKTYKTNRVYGIAGYSFGGLHATWAALNYPDVFTFSGALSPSYWVNNFQIFKEGSKAQAHQVYYFDVGTGEWNYYVPMLLYSKLLILQQIFYYEDFGGLHDIESWRGDRIKNMLLLFAGKTDTNTYHWEIQQEMIKSVVTGKIYPRLNPIIIYSNGLKCSISYAAEFTLLNTADGRINKDGSFQFINPIGLKVKITYRGEEKTITVPYSEYAKIKD
ncbi:MAG: alpha/beta hydrolase-fold protein [Saprospiraceae bacterium]